MVLVGRRMGTVCLLVHDESCRTWLVGRQVVCSQPRVLIKLVTVVVLRKSLKINRAAVRWTCGLEKWYLPSPSTSRALVHILQGIIWNGFALPNHNPWKCDFKISKCILDILISPVVDPFCVKDYVERAVKRRICHRATTHSLFQTVCNLG